MAEEKVKDRAPASSKPRAKAPAASPLEKRSRVFRIAALMARNMYARGEAEVALANEWGVSVATVQDYAAEASRLLTYTTNDLKQLETFCRWRLREIAEMDGPDRVPAINTILKNAGLLSEKHEVQISQLPDRDVVLQAARQALEIPEWREIIRAELAKYETPLLTEGVEVDEDE